MIIAYTDTQTMPALTFIDLFCGIGAFHTSLTKLGCECVFASDIDERAKRTYELNHGMKPAGDIKKIDAEAIPAFDILCAGFPCQPFSIAGNQAGFGDATRGTLFDEILRIADHHRPKFMVLENVKNLLTHDGGKTRQRITDALQERGYTTQCALLNASHFGVPQCRERVYFVCVREDVAADHTGFSLATLSRVVPTPAVSTILDEGESADNFERSLRERYEFVPAKDTEDTAPQEDPLQDADPSKPKLEFRLVNKTTKKGGRQGERVYSVAHPGVTVCAASGGPGSSTGLYATDDGVRPLTVKETLRMFGFPEDFKYECSNKKMIGMLGNSICVPVLDAIFHSLLVPRTPSVLR